MGAATLGALRAQASSAVLFRRRARAARLRAVLYGLVAVFTLGTVLGLAFAGSPSTLPQGVQIAGIDVGGMSAEEATALLEGRAAELERVPVAFVAGSDRFELSPVQLGVEVDWAGAVETARRQGEGFGPVRGFRRLHVRFFGADISPAVEVYDAALAFAVSEIERAVAQPARDAGLRLQGLKPVLVPASTGHALDRAAAEGVVVRALSAFARNPVGLPVSIAAPDVTGADLRPALRDARTALSGPFRLDLAGTMWRVPPRRIAELLLLPRNGATALTVGGLAAEAYLDGVARRIERRPQDAGFRVLDDGSVRVVPGVDGRELDRGATADAILAAVVSPTRRLAQVQVVPAEPELTTAKAKAMGITGTLATYSTAYAGSADRIHNLQLAVSLLDGTLVAPGGTFSLNEAVGERTAERGFRSAPVIIGNEYEEDIGGGVSQVATTIFNAAWEAGLKISERNPHGLYISRYPLGRDATVNYPNLDLKFVNDTKRWILVKGWSTDSGITIGLYGAPTGRSVESETGLLTVRGAAPVERVEDPTLERGKREIEEEGQPPRSIWAKRTVYLANGEVLYDETWSTYYRGEDRVVRVGTKPKPKPEEEAKAKAAADKARTATTPTETEPAPVPSP